MTRSTGEVLADHVKLRLADDLETDLARNYSPDVVLVTTFGVFRGKDGVRAAARLLAEELPSPSFKIEQCVTDGELAVLVWSARADGTHVCQGVDSFVVRDGLIQAVTIHYEVRDGDTKEDEAAATACPS